MKICDRHNRRGQMVEAAHEIELETQRIDLCAPCLSALYDFLANPDAYARETHAGGADGLWGNAPEQLSDHSGRKKAN